MLPGRRTAALTPPPALSSTTSDADKQTRSPAAEATSYVSAVDKFGTAPPRPSARTPLANSPLHRSAPPGAPPLALSPVVVAMPSSYTPPPLPPLAPPPVVPLAPAPSPPHDSEADHHQQQQQRSTSNEQSRQPLSRSISSSFKSVVGMRSSKKLSWDQYFERTGPMDFARSSQTRELVRKHGIPATYRGAFWRILSCSDELRDNDLSYHIIQSNYSQIDPETADQIEKDLQRTFPEQQQFKGENAEGVQALRRILTAYSCFDSELGYCQSMNFVVALLLLFMHEEDAFWTLATIIQRLLPHDYYQSMFGVRVDIQTFCSLLAARLPKLWSHLDGLGVDRQLIQGLILPWFLCLYVNVLPLESTLRFFDSFFFEGDKVLFRVALALFKLHDRHLLACETMSEAVQTIVAMPQNVEPTSLMDTAFDDGWLGRLKRGKIASLRAQHEKELADSCPFPRGPRTRTPRPLGMRNAAPLSPKAKSPPPRPSPPPSAQQSLDFAQLALPPGLSCPSGSRASLSPPSSPRPADTPPPLSPRHSDSSSSLPSSSSPLSSSSSPAHPSSSPPMPAATPVSLLPVGIQPSRASQRSSKRPPASPILPLDLLPSPDTAPVAAQPVAASQTQEPPRDGFFYRAGSEKRRPVLISSPTAYLPPPSAAPAPPVVQPAPAADLEEELDPRFAERYSRLSVLVGRFSMMGPSPNDT